MFIYRRITVLWLQFHFQYGAPCHFYYGGINMRRETGMSGNNLDNRRKDGHTFQSAYALHDVGEAHVRQHCEDLGLTVSDWGLNARDDDGEGVLFDDRMDLKLYYSGELCGLNEIKTKSSESWFGVINRRHFGHYLVHAHEHDVPAWITMCLVEQDDEEDLQYISRIAFIPVREWDGLVPMMDDVDWDIDDRDQKGWSGLEDHPDVERHWQARDGNCVVKLDEDIYRDWSQFAFSVGTADTVFGSCEGSGDRSQSGTDEVF